MSDQLPKPDKLRAAFAKFIQGAIDLDKRLVFRVSGKRLPSNKQLKYLPRFLTDAEKRTIRLLSLVVVVGCIVIGVKYMTDHIVTVPTPGGEYTEASVGAPRFVNPVLAAANDADLDLIRLVYSGLMKTDARGELVPDLAESYAISEDGKTYTFTLRENVQWHDGTAFLPQDVVFTAEAIKSEGWRSPLRSRFKNVQVAAPDQRTVVFTLPEPFTPFLSLLTVGIIPEHLWGDVKPENAAHAESNLKPIGTGPYTFKSYAKDRKGAIRTYTLEANDLFYDAPPFIRTITFRYFPDFAQAADAYLARRTDGMSFLPLEFRDAADAAQTNRIYTLRLPQYTAVFLNPKQNPYLEPVAVRQALAYAVDRDRILRDTLGDNGAPVYGPIPPGFIGFHAEIKKYARDLDAANRLLNDAGWPMDAELGYRAKLLPDPEKEGEKVMTPLAMTLTTVDTKENMTVAQILKDGWEAIGVKVAIEVVPAAKIQAEKLRQRKYGALLYGEILGKDPDPYPFWHSSQNSESGLNLAVYANRRADELLEKARATSDEQQRAQYYIDFQNLLAEDMPAIFLYSPTYTYVVNAKVKGVGTKTIYEPADRFADVTAWYIETKREFR